MKEAKRSYFYMIFRVYEVKKEAKQATSPYFYYEVNK